MYFDENTVGRNYILAPFPYTVACRTFGGPVDYKFAVSAVHTATEVPLRGFVF